VSTPARSPSWRVARYGALAAVLGLVGIVGIALGHALVARGFPELSPWHTLEPEGEPDAAALDAGLDLAGYLRAEQRVFAASAGELAGALDSGDASYGSRYAPDSPNHPARFAVDWNRTFERVPAQPRGVALLVHGMTDGPYSLRAIADVLHAEGWHVLALRLQRHGTVPAALLDARWEDWAAAVRLGVRHLRARQPSLPLLLVGYSTGAALVLQHELDAIERSGAATANRLVLLSPMIGLRRAAGAAPLLTLLDGIPGLEKAAWLEVMPEYNPFKYNSFPVNGGWQSWRLTRALSTQLARLQADGRLDTLPPLLTFQSVLDSTVLADAVVHELYDRLPANGSTLVLYDVNRWRTFAPAFSREPLDAAHALLRTGARRYTLQVVTNVDPSSREVHELALAPGRQVPAVRPLGLAFPPEVYSLSHTAIPFPPDDPLYGIHPRTDEDFGVRLGTLALRGERNALWVSMDQLARLNCNPFFDDLAARVRAFTAEARGSGGESRRSGPPR
jgi:alpha-beta hydrolase superfamily lysophospholipase